MTNETKHTPTPWEVVVAPSGTPDITDAKGQVVAAVFGGKADSNAAHIVKCVNMHDELLERLRELMELTEDPENDADECESVFVAARETLKKAGAL